MKNRSIAHIILTGLLIGAFNSSVFSQKAPKIKVSGEIVAFDKFSSLLHLTFVPTKNQLLLVRVSKVLDGKESSGYLLVQYEYTSDISALPVIGENANNHFKMKLKRKSSCDSALSGLTAKVQGASNPRRTVPRMEWIETGVNLPADQRLPCYILKEGDFETSSAK